MPSFPRYDAAALLGITPVATIKPEELWEQLITPQVSRALGPITSITGPIVRETEEGAFPGDKVSNLHKHMLFGGKPGFVRCPYLTTIYHTADGALLVKEDGIKLEATGWIGDIMKGKAELIYEVALRDRCFDGTPRADDSPLVAWPFSDPVLHQRLPHGRSVEASIYGFRPGSRLTEAFGDPQYEEFVRQPYQFLDRPELFLKYFKQAFAGRRGPGQVGSPFPDVAKVIDSGVSNLARAKGYDFVEATTSHYNVAMFVQAFGYRFNFSEQAKTFGDLYKGVQALKKSLNLSRSQETWATVIQSLRPVELIPKELYLGGPTWPWDNIGLDYLWLNKALNPEAQAALPGPISRYPKPATSACADSNAKAGSDSVKASSDSAQAPGATSPSPATGEAAPKA